MTETQYHDLGDFTLQHGATLRGARLAYTTYGTLNADKSNAVVYPTWYSGRHWDNKCCGVSLLAFDQRWNPNEDHQPRFRYEPGFADRPSVAVMIDVMAMSPSGQ